MTRTRRSWLRRIASSYLLVVVVGLVIGAILAPAIWGMAAPEPDPTVAVVPLSGSITGESAQATIEQLERADRNGNVEAIVLAVNSPGGSAAASEDLYLATSSVANDTPLVSSVDASATSGAYYAMAPSDDIFVKPASVVGSVGVIAQPAGSVEPTDLIVTSGPHKAAEDERDFRYMVDSLQRAFVGAVFDQRGDRIDLSPETVGEARIYSGGQAVDHGLADEIGGRDRAVRRAAELADLEEYRVEVFRPGQDRTLFLTRNAFLASDHPNKTMVNRSYVAGDDALDGPVFLMLPAQYLGSDDGAVPRELVEGEAATTAETRAETSSTGEVTPDGR